MTEPRTKYFLLVNLNKSDIFVEEFVYRNYAELSKKEIDLKLLYCNSLGYVMEKFDDKIELEERKRSLSIHF